MFFAFFPTWCDPRTKFGISGCAGAKNPPAFSCEPVRLYEEHAVPGDLDIRCVSRDLVARRVRIVADELGALKRILARGSAHRAPAERKQSEIFESRTPKRKRFVREQTYPVYIVDDLRRDSVLFQRFEQKYERQRMVGASRDSSDKSQRIRAARYGTADRKLRVRLILHRRGTVQLYAVGNGGYRIHIADEHVGRKPERECVIPSAARLQNNTKNPPHFCAGDLSESKTVKTNHPSGDKETNLSLPP